MTTLISSIFLASLIGSPHCVGMCGPFVAVAVGGRELPARRHVSTQLAYHLGRGTTYVLLGATAGLLGSFVDLSARLAGIQSAAAILAGVAMIGFGLLTLLSSRGVRFGSCRNTPRVVATLLRSGHRLAATRGPVVRASLVGLLTTLLPCGWLWAFAITAAGTASPGLGAVVMFAFWLGTLPALVALGLGLQSLSGVLARHLPTITSVLILAAGIYTVVGRAMLDPARLVAALSSDQTTPEPACCQE
jgi:uncharacterized protein